MRYEFKYGPKRSINQSIASFIIPVALIVVPIIFPHVFIIKQKIIILLYPYFAFLLVFIGAILFISEFIRYRKESIVRKYCKPIVVERDKVTYIKIEKGKPIEETFLISEVESSKFDSEERVVTIFTKKHGYEFDSEYFESIEHFYEFYNYVA